MASDCKEYNKYKNPMSGMDRYGKQRLQLATLLRDILPKSLPWIIDGGSLLGAWRNGKFITHDDDFDFAIFFEEDGESKLIELLKELQDRLPAPYEARLISTYCHKIEVFDPTYGSYILEGPGYNGANYHHVSADIQPYQRAGENYSAMYYTELCNFNFNVEDVFPIGSIELEGEKFNAPKNVKQALKGLYGSLSPKAHYNKNTGKYEDPSEEDQNGKSDKDKH